MEQMLLPSLSDDEFDLIRRLIHEHLGIHLTSNKRALVAGRLNFFLREKGYSDFHAYHEGIRRDTTGKELSELADRITTNHTFFNRERAHFEYFSGTVLPQLKEEKLRNGSRSFKIWCAASSTGEEPYMLAMLLMEFLGLDYKNWDAGILATDISEKALGEARLGIYSEERILNLPEALRARYFRKLPDGTYQAQSRLQQEVTFRRFNLINPDFPFRSGFDVIFCRNVMIYFDTPTKETLVGKMHKFTNPGGYFFVGHSESMDRKSCPFQFVRPAIYRKRPAHA
jgi:chemotaxis protein methyltransferase CheR